MDVATRGMLVGMVLGDAYVSVRNRMKDGKYAYVSSEMRILHSLSQKDYCEHKAGLTAKALNRNPSVTVVKNGPGKKYLAAQFSVSHPYFKQLKEWCYPGGVKTFTTKILRMLTPEGIALWYMDDGHARVNVNSKGWVSSVATNIATMCSEAEASIIRDYFLNEHSIKFSVRCRKGMREDKAFFVETNTDGSRDFVRLVSPYIIPSMKYKIAHVADLASHECRAPIGRCECGSAIFDKRRKGLCDACYSRKYYREIRRFRENRKPSLASESW